MGTNSPAFLDQMGILEVLFISRLLILWLWVLLKRLVFPELHFGLI